ncbi:MAG: ABC transporter permease [Acidobacteria bacterium]|nr:ABC transporter permease [Acidobacteriota bacterium]
MVIRWPRLRALDRKLVRDVWAMKGQAVAIAAVVAAGVTMFVTYLSTFASLQQARTDYFAHERMADVFASLTRAPVALEARLAALPGVEQVTTRVVADVTLDVPGLDEPATGRLVSIPDRGRPALNGVRLRRGRWIEPGRPDEVLASELFCEANGLVPGDQLPAVINGRRRTLTIVGVALSPEYVYAVRPGELIPDRRRFGVLWMGRQGLAAAFDMTGGFNDVALRLAQGAPPDAAIAALDLVLAPYGGLGAIPQRLQISAWTLDNELDQLQIFGLLTPVIFLGVAVFILHVALSRALTLQRAQIAALKALGYGNRALAWHYTKWALAIAFAGASAGVVMGRALGAAMIGLYNVYFRFPDLQFHAAPGVITIAVAGSLLVAALGAQAAVRRAVRIPPAEAMRPDGPERYRHSVIEWPWLQRRLPLTARVVLRNIERQPARSAVSILGIALAVAVLVVGLAFLDIMDGLITHQFGRVMRWDASVTFVAPRSAAARPALARLPGVLDVEPVRVVPVRLRAGPRARTVALTASSTAPRLQRIIDRHGQVLALPDDGLVLSALLGEVLHVGIGATVQVEVLEGARPVRPLRVVRLVDDTLGLQAYLHVDAVHRLLGEGATLSGAHLTIDRNHLAAFHARLKSTPAVAGVAFRETALHNFREAMAENMYVSIFFNVAFAAVIAFGVVYNAARVSLSERARELARLRVLGFTRAEISAVLLGELAVLTALALPAGTVIGVALGQLIMLGFNNEVYRLSFVVQRDTLAWAYLAVSAAAVLSAVIVRRRLDGLDLVGVLKTRE